MAGWPRRDLLDLLGIEHPIIQAPMANAATPALTAAVSNAGGLGSLGSATLSPAQLREQADAFRSESNRIFNANFFVHDAPVVDGTAEAAMRERHAPYYGEMALGEAPAVRDIFPIFNAGMLAAVRDLRPGVVSFHFGLPGRGMIDALKETGAVILACPETDMHPVHREMLLRTPGEETRVTRAISGRPARAIVNRYIAELDADRPEPLTYPLQYSLTAP